MTRPNGSKYSGYDIGSFVTDDNKSTACSQNPDMDAIIIWQKAPKISTLPISSTTSTVSTATQYDYY